MDKDEKIELIDAINNIRKEIGLEPYPLEQLENKDFEELKKLYHQHVTIKEYHQKVGKEKKPRSKLNLKIGLMIGIPIIIVAIIFLMPIQGGKPISSFFYNTTGDNEEQILKFYISFAYKGGNSSVFVLSNIGNTNMTNFTVIIDGEEVGYKINSGTLPLNPNNVIYFQVLLDCGKSHIIKVISNEVEENTTVSGNFCQLT